jgi:glycosyltransferase involved in cell wall biosynthesis
VLGGAEADTQRVFGVLQQRGYPVRVLTCGGNPMPPQGQWVDTVGIPVEILTSGRVGRLQQMLFAWRIAIQLLARRKEFEIVFVSMTGLHLFASLLMGRLLGKRIFVKIHGSTVIPALAGSLLGRVELHWMRHWAERVMVLNEEMVQEALAQDIPRETICYMPNPIDVDEFRPAAKEQRQQLRQRFGFGVDTPVLLYVGRLSPEKGVDWLLQSFARARSRCGNCMLALLGDGPIRAQLEARARELGLSAEAARFLGRVPADDVPQYLQAADAFALVSPNEGFSCALAEAMAVGLPAVVSAIPANVQLVRDGVHGYTAPAGDVDATADAIARLMEDATQRRSMGEAARALVETNFSTHQVIRQYEALFQRPAG